MFRVLTSDPKSRARLGVLETPHGIVSTPSYVIVGTHAKVRCLDAGDIPATKTQMIIANTYHLWRTLGDDGLQSYQGVHADLGWEGPVITDSGGFQVFSLGFLREFGMRKGSKSEGSGKTDKNTVRITPSGVYFMPDDSLEEVYLDAELSIRIQEQLGADIIVAFDEPTSPAHDFAYTKEAMERTHAWALRSLEAKTSDQMIYGVVQGGNFEELRNASASFISGLPFDGFAIGGTYGDGYGGTREATANMLSWSLSHLPDDKPRHLFGVGRIEDLFIGVEAGIDTFDCVIPTREARHGRIWDSHGHIDITRGIYKNDTSILDEACGCETCSAGTRKMDLYSLFKLKDHEAGHLATIHNVYFFNDLMERMRQAIQAGEFSEFKKRYYAQRDLHSE